MNEILFFFQIIILLTFLIIAFKLDKSAVQVFIVLQVVLANLFVSKQIQLFTFSVTCSDAYAVAAIFALNFLQEKYGKEEAKKTVYLSFLAFFIFMSVSQLHLLYKPSSFDKTQKAFFTILSNMPRIAISSLSVFFLIQRFDVFFYGLLKKQKIFKKQSFVLRSSFSAFVSQFLDTVLFSFIGLYKIVDNISQIILVSFFIKILAILTSFVFINFTKKIINLKTENEV